jgi:hypothetical protein
MTGVFDSLVSLWSDIRAGYRPLPTVATVPPDRCRPATTAGYPITRDQTYFVIRINEILRITVFVKRKAKSITIVIKL